MRVPGEEESTTLRVCGSSATMPEVLIAFAPGFFPAASALARSAIRLSTFMGVSSLCSSGACAA